MKRSIPMSVGEFFKLTGKVPVDDDLERVNCHSAGEIGHYHCGWNEKHNCPMWENSDEGLQ